ncbi:MAG: response regulator [Promethearchaeia archaeon]
MFLKIKYDEEKWGDITINEHKQNSAKKKDKSSKKDNYLGKENEETAPKKTPKMKQYEKETGKYAIWRGVVTESYKRWVKGEKVYNRNKERISLYVTEDMKDEWIKFIEESDKYSTISNLIRQSVKEYIDNYTDKKAVFSSINPKKISNISHALKEPLTSIKGYAQLILENHKENLKENVFETIQNIFDQSILLENKIINFLDNIKQKSSKYDILLIEDDLSTIRLIKSYFESKGFEVKGIVSGARGIEELKNGKPKVILLDIILPDLSGYEICQTIKSDEEYKDTPVYYLTAIAGSEVKEKLEETKADGYILKPFNFSDFEFIFDLLKAK